MADATTYTVNGTLHGVNFESKAAFACLVPTRKGVTIEQNLAQFTAAFEKMHGRAPVINTVALGKK